MLDRFERFSFHIFEVTRYWHKITADEMEKFGLKGTHCVYLLAMLQHPEGITAAKLGELCGRDKADVSRMVSIMEQKGLVIRESVAKNLYRGLLKLTREGMAAAEYVSRRVKVAVELASKGLDEVRRGMFYDALELIVTNLRGISDDGLPEPTEAATVSNIKSGKDLSPCLYGS